MTISLAIPSKGRLQAQTFDALAKAGLPVEQPNKRNYTAGLIGRGEVEVFCFPASEIVAKLARGAVDIGITGEDLLLESSDDWNEKMEIIARLGFARADIVVAVPQVWLDVETIADLDDVAADFHQRHGRRLRIATKYRRLTQRFLSGVHGMHAYRIVESVGATEGAPAVGSADVIVDVTTTGATLKANHLKVLEDGVILRSQACLVVARKRQVEIDASLIKKITEKLVSNRDGPFNEISESGSMKCGVPTLGVSWGNETAKEARTNFT
ncbi:ATP phosphoribosyltransferase [Paraburkholderia phenoliruptrix]|uniref:ATP phosphoribosyltransferase n=2 Tax=Paraburkholderia phenoliruptrix TaxID=252970 RepID=K0E1Z8_9BURK|nr:ATP phosphoribosyltransferase [Paraburkholderia phenoliruptrix]AFT90518.1 ATP phosphoribosyltransferase [Paraburkholderia phenoliruptrix BR3459a]CAB4053037.1 ATP phosphoribosyltransferase [Paraburkholderia phenoliruptrix]